MSDPDLIDTQVKLMLLIVAMRASQELIDFVADLRNEVGYVWATRHTTNQLVYVDRGKLTGLAAGCRLLIVKLGPFGKVWDDMLQNPSDNYESSLENINAVLDTITNALTKGRLSSVEELVSAEVLGDLVDHADTLLKAKYYLAAAIVLRAVLEERLRKLCDGNGCAPTVQKPTIESFKQSLYAAKIVDKIGAKDIDWMAGVGNAAAHQLPEYKDEDVPQLYQRVLSFLTRFSVT